MKFKRKPGAVPSGRTIPSDIGVPAVATAGSAHTLAFTAGGLSFGGAGDSLDFGDPIWTAGSKPAAMCVWASANDISPGRAVAFSFGAPFNGRAMYIGRDGSALVAGFYGEQREFLLDHFWTLNVRDQVCLVYDGETASVYANGSLLATRDFTVDIDPSHAYAGCQVDGTQSWNGTIAEVAFWNKNLGGSDIASLYSRQAPLYARTNTPRSPASVPGASASPATRPPASPVAVASPDPAAIRKWAGVTAAMIEERDPARVVAIGAAAGLIPIIADGQTVVAPGFTASFLDPDTHQLVFHMSTQSDIVLTTTGGMDNPRLAPTDYQDDREADPSASASLSSSLQKFTNITDPYLGHVWAESYSWMCNVSGSYMFAGVNEYHRPYIESILSPGQKRVEVMVDLRTENADFKNRFLDRGVLNGAIQDIGQDLAAVPLQFSQPIFFSTDIRTAITANQIHTTPMVLACSPHLKAGVWGQAHIKTDYTQLPAFSVGQIELGCNCLNANSNDNPATPQTAPTTAPSCQTGTYSTASIAYDRTALRHEMYHTLGFPHSASQSVMNYAYELDDRYRATTWQFWSGKPSPGYQYDPNKKPFWKNWTQWNALEADPPQDRKVHAVTNPDGTRSWKKPQVCSRWKPNGQPLPAFLTDGSGADPDRFYPPFPNPAPYAPPPPNAVLALQEIVSPNTNFLPFEYPYCKINKLYIESQMTVDAVKQNGVYSCDWLSFYPVPGASSSPQDVDDTIVSNINQLNSYYTSIHQGFQAGASSASNPGVGSGCFGMFKDKSSSNQRPPPPPMPPQLVTDCKTPSTPPPPAPTPTPQVPPYPNVLGGPLGMNQPSPPDPSQTQAGAEGGISSSVLGSSKVASSKSGGGGTDPGTTPADVTIPAVPPIAGTNGSPITPPTLSMPSLNSDNPALASLPGLGNPLSTAPPPPASGGDGGGFNSTNPNGLTALPLTPAATQLGLPDVNSVGNPPATSSGNGGALDANCQTAIAIAKAQGKDVSKFQCNTTVALINNTNTMVGQGQTAGADEVAGLGQQLTSSLSASGSLLSQSQIYSSAQKLSGTAGSTQSNVGVAQIVGGAIEAQAAQKHSNNAKQFATATNQNSYQAATAGPNGQTITAAAGPNSMAGGALSVTAGQNLTSSNSVTLTNGQSATSVIQNATKNAQIAMAQQQAMARQAQMAATRDLLAGAMTLYQGMQAQQGAQADSETTKALTSGSGAVFAVGPGSNSSANPSDKSGNSPPTTDAAEPSASAEGSFSSTNVSVKSDSALAAPEIPTAPQPGLNTPAGSEPPLATADPPGERSPAGTFANPFGSTAAPAPDPSPSPSSSPRSP